MKKLMTIPMSLLLIFTSAPLWARKFGGFDSGYHDDGFDLWIMQMAQGRPWVLVVFAIVRFVIVVGIIIAVFLILRRLLRGKKLPWSRASHAKKIVEERYARGEIDGNTMREMLKNLETNK